MNNKTIIFFKEISKIPRESGNEKDISNYICDFAKKHNLEYIQDKYGNVIIKKYNGTNLPIILHSHLDMVCEKDNIDHNFKTDPIEVYEEGGYLKANGTTLGADNGIGVAQILNVLDDNLKINVEAIFTVSEETTMCGAENIDLSSLKGKQMISLDGFDKKTIITESASFYDIVMNLNYNVISENNNDYKYKINLFGMPGGHSGFDIDKNRGNSGIELAKFLNKIESVQIASFVAGTKFNVIPSQAECEFTTNLDWDNFKDMVKVFNKDLNKKYQNVKIKFEKIENKPNMKLLSSTESQRFLNTIISFKHGVFFKDERGLITTSANLGVVDLKNNIFKIGVRSSRKKESDNILEYLKNYASENDYEFVILGHQPGFETQKNSNLIKNLIKAYNISIDDDKLSLIPSHVTLESGFFTKKISNLEVAIISPLIIGAHTTRERVEIESIFECDKWIYAFFELMYQ